MKTLTEYCHPLAPDVLVQEGGHLARVGPGQLQGGPEEEEGPVTLEPVAVDRVGKVEPPAEKVADHLRGTEQ